MRRKIISELKLIERENEIRILYAVESGSRAWGFASIDSDYDVRFIYIHPLNWYLSIWEKKDVLEYMLKGDLDISGWDIRKALQLLSKSNPPLLEWLQSPIKYIESYSTISQMRKIVAKFFSPLSCLHHYLHMAEGNYKAYLSKEKVNLKKYFYVIRPVLACRWIEQNKTMPPMEFEVLVKSLIKDKKLLEEIRGLLKRKIDGEELSLGARIPKIHKFLEGEIEHYRKYIKSLKKGKVIDSDMLDGFFQDAIKEVFC